MSPFAISIVDTIFKCTSLIKTFKQSGKNSDINNVYRTKSTILWLIKLYGNHVYIKYPFPILVMRRGKENMEIMNFIRQTVIFSAETSKNNLTKK